MKIRIDVPVYNRKEITELVLMQLYKTKAEQDQIFIYNDNSTDYDDTWLSQWGTVIKYEMPKQDRWKNIHLIRSYAYRDFLNNWHKPNQNFDFLYLTDNDAFHDINWRQNLINLHNNFNMACTGYISSYMYNNYEYYSKQINFQPKIIRSSGGGISIFLNKKQVQTIVNRMGMNSIVDMWDCVTWSYLNNVYAITEKSYLDHFGKGGLHHQDWDNERAINPTEYLVKIRPEIIKYLEGLINRSDILNILAL